MLYFVLVLLSQGLWRLRFEVGDTLDDRAHEAVDVLDNIEFGWHSRIQMRHVTHCAVCILKPGSPVNP